MGLALLPAADAAGQAAGAQGSGAPPPTVSPTDEALVAQGRNQWGQYAPPLQARNAGQVTQSNRATQSPAKPAAQTAVPLTMGAGPHTSPLTSGDAATGWQPAPSPAASPRSRPADLPPAKLATDAAPAAPEGTARPGSDAQLAGWPDPRLAKPLPVPEGARLAPLRRQADGRSQEFRRRWMIGNFY